MALRLYACWAGELCMVTAPADLPAHQPAAAEDLQRSQPEASRPVAAYPWKTAPIMQGACPFPFAAARSLQVVSADIYAWVWIVLEPKFVPKKLII